jgi:hypothetical protein
MQRNSNTLFLIAPGPTTVLLPWVNNAPDFTGFTDPTLSVLQQSWVAFLESGGELEVIADPVPSPPQPDWDGFLAEFLSPGNPVYNATALKVQASSPYTQEHWANMRIGITNPLIRNEQWLQECSTFLETLLEADNNPLTAEEKDNWVILAAAHHITLVL